MSMYNKQLKIILDKYTMNIASLKKFLSIAFYIIKCKYTRMRAFK